MEYPVVYSGHSGVPGGVQWPQWWLQWRIQWGRYWPQWRIQLGRYWPQWWYSGCTVATVVVTVGNSGGGHPDPYHGAAPGIDPPVPPPIPRVPTTPPAHRTDTLGHRSTAPCTREPRGNVSFSEISAHGVLQKTTVSCISGIRS